MGKWLDRVIERKESEGENPGYIPKNDTDSVDTMAVPDKPMGGGIDFIDHLTETEQEYYRDLLEIMQSPKFGMDREAAERKAEGIIARKRQPLQVKQAAQDYRKYGYTKIFSTALNQPLYLAKDQMASRRVPDKSIPIFLWSDLETVKGLVPETALVLLEARLIFDGQILIEDYSEPRMPQKMDGKQLARSFYGKKSDGKEKTSKS